MTKSEEPKQNILVIGYYNHDNLGDEQYKISFDYLFRQFLPDYNTYNIRYIDCDLLKITPTTDTDIIILGGGDVLNGYFLDQIIAKFAGKSNKVFAVSVGLPYEKILTNTTKLSVIDYIFLRTKQDIDFMSKYFSADRILYFPDMSYYLSMVYKKDRATYSNEFLTLKDKIASYWKSGNRIVAFSLNRHIYSSRYCDYYDLIVKEFAEFIYHIVQNKYIAVLLPFNTSTSIADAYTNMENDLLIHQDIMRILIKDNPQYIKHIINIDFTLSVRETLYLYKYFHVTVPMRFHACLFSIYKNVPLIPVFTTKKIRNLMLDAKWKYYYELDKNGSDIPIAMNGKKLQNLFDEVVVNQENYQRYIQHLNIINTDVFSRNLRRTVPQLIEAIVSEYPRIQTMVPIAYSQETIINNLFLKLQTYVREHGVLDFRQLKDRNMQQIAVNMVSYHLTNTIDTPYNHGLMEKMFTNKAEYNYREEWKWILNHYQPNSHSISNPTNPDGLFNLHYIDQSDPSGSHRSGWQYVYENIKHLHNPSRTKPLMDLYVDRTFHWKRELFKAIGIIPYTAPWCGFIHHTFEREFSEYNNYTLLECQEFIDSLPFCKCLFVLSVNLKKQLTEELAKKQWNIPVHALVHPTITNIPNFTMNNLLNNKSAKIIHIGGWLRNVFTFYQLQLPTTIPYYTNTLFGTLVNSGSRTLSIKKAALKGKHMNNYYPCNNLTDKLKDTLQRPCGEAALASTPTPHCSQNSSELTNNWYKHFMGYVENINSSVELIDNLTNEDYDNLLSENIVFIHLVDASTVNTVIECIVRNTPIIVNRHPAVVELLGPSYPFYYDTSVNLFEINKQVNKLLNSIANIKKAYRYLKTMDKTKLSIGYFINQFTEIMKSYNNM